MVTNLVYQDKVQKGKVYDVWSWNGNLIIIFLKSDKEKTNKTVAFQESAAVKSLWSVKCFYKKSQFLSNNYKTVE